VRVNLQADTTIVFVLLLINAFLTDCMELLLEKPIVIQLIKPFFIFYGIQDDKSAQLGHIIN
jgi:hypothetical protein